MCYWWDVDVWVVCGFLVDWEGFEYVFEVYVVVCFFLYLFCEVEWVFCGWDVRVDVKGECFVDE